MEENAKFRELTVNWRKIYISTDDTDGHGWRSAGGRGTWENNDYGFFWLDWCPQADDVGERELSGIKRELKKKLFMEINGIFMAIHVQKLSMLFWGWTRIIGNRPWIGGNRSASGRERGEQVSINDERLMINDGVHTENADDAECYHDCGLPRKGLFFSLESVSLGLAKYK